MHQPTDAVTRAFAGWKANLVDLTTANPLLHFRPDQNTLRLALPAAGDLLRQVTSAEASPHFRLIHSAAAHETGVIVGHDPHGTAGTTLRALRQHARLALDEQGVHILYLTFGNLPWDTREEEALDSPILILPVTLHRATAFADYTLAAADRVPDLTLNPALAIKLRQDYNLDLGATLKGGDLALETVLEAVRDSIADHYNWVVSDSAHLTLLPFAKYVLHEDLERHEADFLQHPVIRGIGGETGALLTALPAPPTDTDPVTDWQVLDADHSQRLAIATVRQGGSVVIQGPPGTGKSQTIANLVAESLGQGKTVLFVSEKKAALQVVSQRLAMVGLGEFCLAPHDDDLDEADVVDDLADRSGMGMPREMSIPPSLQRAAAIAAGGDLATIRAGIDAYHQALADRDSPFGSSTYDVIGELAHLADAPVVQFDYDPAISGGLTAARVASFADALDDLCQVAPILLAPEQHPWRSIDPVAVRADPATRYRLEERLASLATAATDLYERQLATGREWGLPAATTPGAARDLHTLLDTCARPPAAITLPAWFRRETWEQARAMLAHEQADGAQARERRAHLLTRYRQAFLDEDLVRSLEDALDLDQSGILRPDAALTGLPPTSPELQAPARFAAALVLAMLQQVIDLGEQVAQRYGLQSPATIAQFTRMHRLVTLAGTGKPPRRHWFQASERDRLRALATEAGEHARVLAERDAFLTRWRPRIFAEATDDTIARLEEPLDSLWDRLDGLLRWDLPRVEGLGNPPIRLTRAEAAAALRQARAIRLASAWFDDHAADLDLEFAHYDAGPGTDWEAVRDALAIVGDAAEMIDPLDPPAVLVDFPAQLTRRDDLVDRFGQALAQLDSSVAMLAAVAPAHLVPLVSEMRTRPAAEIAAELRWSHLGGHEAMTESVATLATLRLAPWTTCEAFVADLHDAATLIERERALRDVFGRHYLGESTNWAAIETSLAWIGRIRARFGFGDPPSALVGHVVDKPALAPERTREMASALDRLKHATCRLLPFFTARALVHDPGFDATPLPEIAGWASGLRQDLSGLDRWLFALHAQERADALGMTPFLDAVRAARVPAERWPDAFDRQLRTLWLTWRLGTAPELAAFAQSAPDTQRTRFATLDRAQLAANAVRLIGELRERQRLALADVALLPEIAVLRQLASANGQHPLRTLCTDAARLLPAITPCLLMSPMSVARLLGHSPLRFDVVIFDEASQVLPQDAIGAIGRGRQLVVVGDSQQLPPTNFFQAAAGDQQSESLLDACTIAGLPNTWLQWHYRSRHEDLIAFANREFYENRLVTFPAPDQGIDPIDFVFVENGMYDRGATRANAIEAARLVDLVIAQVDADPESSVGIITFSEAQMLAVQEELDLRRRNAPELEARLAGEGPDGLFVRNLENVQGDERDIIFISVGYGPDSSGKTLHNFGPINRDGGDRRLNVAITRARRKVIVLCSFDPNELRTSSTRGVQVLHRYLNFARQDGDEPRPVSTPLDDDTRSFANAVAGALARAGLPVIRDVGVGQCRVDLGIPDPAAPGRFLLGILCDGAQYRAAVDARDRERLRPQVLEALGWRLHHVWSMAWQADPRRELERIVDLVDRIRRESPAPAAAPVEMPPAPVVDPTPANLAGDDPEGGFLVDWGAGADAPEPAPPPPPRPREPKPEPPPIPETAPEPEPEPPMAEPEPEPVPPVQPKPEPPVVPEPEPEPEPTPPPRPEPEQPVVPEPESTPAPPVQPEPDPAPPTPRKKRRTTGGTQAGGAARRDPGIDEIKGLTAAARRKLEAAGIGTLGALLERTATPKAHRALAKSLGVEPAVLTDWVNRADLMRVTGIGTQFANLLEFCGVASCREMRQRVPENLLARLQEVNAERALTKRLPTLAQLRDWIAMADTIATADDARDRSASAP